MNNIYKFDKNTRYITKGISEQLPPSLVVYLWSTLDDFIASKHKVDYLQIFKIQASYGFIKISHYQEEPAYSRELQLSIETSGISADELPKSEIKIYIIDDIDHSTMLLAEEY